jgi:hypothetical protein
MDSSIDIQKVLELHQKWLRCENGGERANFDYTDLYKANLYGANLSYASLIYANLHKADMNGANLNGTDIAGTNLYMASLIGANLYDANLNGANLNSANLEGANLRDSSLNNANLDFAILSNADLKNACLSNISFNDCTKFDFKILSIHGSRDKLILIKNKNVYMLYIGCYGYTLDHWKKYYKFIGRQNRYTEKEIEEYYGHILHLEKCIN